MIHSEPSLSSTPFFGASQPLYLDASENEYYRSTASSICSESSHFPQSDTDDDVSDYHLESKAAPTIDSLQTLIATVPESRLRTTMLRLASRSPQFRHAIAKELETSSKMTPLESRGRSMRKHRRGAGGNISCPSISTCSNCGQAFDTGNNSACHYHPGQLEDDIYEFMSKSPEGRIFKVLKSVSMWSCCEEEPGSVGCVEVPMHVELDQVD
ncbi:hypothetical protein F5878DRAFT_451286 [Lentinula raphanica]|uniref:C2H2-type domain-containing protein n=1 Tax=Lentinula raphanica TaxID=153919 RepID=A0AA38NY00_9AGAR|nr:hypothetical protein F5880DRAFT_316285 [Lentinula raphanica]KAJ3832615.1 hypothetical protein F5878DRAFT_451286 [Lentinula raphanica]